jgi:diaminopimelate epimerase
MIKFQKMHGLGNDFILLHDINPQDYDLKKLAIYLCNRHTGIGADGIMLVLPSDRADIQMRIVNSDGSEANMCGNGIRCFAKYVFENGIIAKETFTIETYAGIMIPELQVENGMVKSVKVNMGSPKLERDDIPMTGQNGHVINEPLTIHDKTYSITSMLMGVPHTMVFVDEVDSFDIVGVGRQIEKHPDFPQRTNVNFVEVVNNHEIKVRTWERGAGSTLACGTGCCASAVASILNEKTVDKVIVHLALGDLIIEWINGIVFMTGPATNICSGQMAIANYHAKYIE